MSSINAVTIVGNLTRDVELRHAGELPVTDLGIAVNGREKQNGEWTERADFFDVTVFGKTAELCAQYLAKGRPVAISGRLRQDRWTNDAGENRSKVKIVADQVQFLRGSEADDNGKPQQQAPQQAPEPAQAAQDDEIPF